MIARLTMARQWLDITDTRGWNRHIVVLAVVWSVLLILFHRDVADLVGIWWNSSTFAHCLLLVPIIGWLVALRRPLLARLTPDGWWPALLPMAGAGALWLVGDLAGVAVLRHAALIVMLQSSVLGVLGPQVARGLMFPLVAMFLLVPVGEELVAPLQTLTAAMSMALLHLTGVPAHIEGVFITTPGGYFEVAEACSGVKFLIAMFAYSTLVANLCFRSWMRRAAFMVFAIVVPILANGFRAFGTIWIAEHTGVEFAAGFDHIIYGWVFFGIVIIGVLAAAWPFFDRHPDDPAFDPHRIPATRRGAVRGDTMAALMLMLAAVPLIWASAAHARSGPLPTALVMPALQGWQVVPQSGYPWTAHYAGADRLAHVRYARADGRTVDIVIAAFAAQAEGREVAGFGQGAIDPASDWAWSEGIPAVEGGRGMRIIAPGPVVRDTMIWHRIDGATTASGPMTKWLTLRAALLAGDPRAVAIVASAEVPDGGDGRTVIADFLRAAGGIDELADRAIETR